jgi:hypothetical protein
MLRVLEPALQFVMVLKSYNYGGCAVVVWVRRNGIIEVGCQMDIGVQRLQQASKTALSSHPRALPVVLTQMPIVDPLKWESFEVVPPGAVLPTLLNPLSFDIDWYTARSPTYTAVGVVALLRLRLNLAEWPATANTDPVIDCGAIYYDMFRLQV